MKVSGIWVMYLVAGTALMVLAFSPTSTCLPTADVVFADSGGTVIMAPISRKLKENGFGSSSASINLEDYRPIDPVPSSKASIKPGPIQHGTPLNPYIPRPSPPSPAHPETGGQS